MTGGDINRNCDNYSDGDCALCNDVSCLTRSAVLESAPVMALTFAVLGASAWSVVQVRAHISLKFCMACFNYKILRIQQCATTCVIIVYYASKAATQYRVTPQKVKTLESLTYNENKKEKQHTSNI